MASDPDQGQSGPAPAPQPASGGAGVTPPRPAPSAPGNGAGRSQAIELTLGGALPCVACGYDLRGISILDVCPECGTNVRATLLAAVDPMAEELIPLRSPTLLASGIVLWSFGALLALIAAWWQIAPEIPELIGGHARPISLAAGGALQILMAFGLIMSMIGAVTLVDPHPGTRPGIKLSAIIGVVLYLPAIAATLLTPELTHGPRPGAGFGGIAMWTPAPDRTLWRAFVWLCILGMLVCLRPAARAMAARSVLLRTGRVDRQTMLAMATAAGVLIVGDLLAMLAVVSTSSYDQAAASFAYIGGAVLWAMGGVLITVGAAGSIVDCVRIARSVLNPAPSMRQALGHPATPVSAAGSDSTPPTASFKAPAKDPRS